MPSTAVPPTAVPSPAAPPTSAPSTIAPPTGTRATSAPPTAPRATGRTTRDAGARRLSVPVGALVTVLLLAACAGPAGDGTDDAAAGPAAGTSVEGGEPNPDLSTTYPLTLDNCGVEVTIEAAPQRVVAIKSSAIEMLLALGVGDRVVGTAFPDGPAPAELAEQAAMLPVLSERVPSAEVVLQAEPDLVYAGWESNLSADGAGDRSMLAGLGVASYVSPSACKDPAHQPETLTFELVFGEIIEVGALVGVPAAAADLVAAQQSELAATTPDARGLTALWYSSGTDVPYVGAGIGAPQMIMDAVGLKNTAAGVADTWTAFSWEQVAQDDPDVIVLVDAAWNTAEAKRELLATSPATANLTAVINESYLVVPFAASEAGVRNVAAVSDLLEQLAALDPPR